MQKLYKDLCVTTQDGSVISVCKWWQRSWWRQIAHSRRAHVPHRASQSVGMGWLLKAKNTKEGRKVCCTGLKAISEEEKRQGMILAWEGIIGTQRTSSHTVIFLIDCISSIRLLEPRYIQGREEQLMTLYACHINANSGHIGIECTTARVSEQYVWNGVVMEGCKGNKIPMYGITPNPTLKIIWGVSLVLRAYVSKADLEDQCFLPSWIWKPKVDLGCQFLCQKWVGGGGNLD